MKKQRKEEKVMFRNRNRRRRREHIYTFEEARRMEHRRNVQKKVFPFVVGVLCVVIVMVFGIYMIHQNSTENKTGNQVETSEQQETTQNTMSTQNSEETQVVSQMTEQDSEQNVTENATEQGTEANSQTQQVEQEVYNFTSTPNTVTVANEEIISSNIILVDESTDTIIAERSAMERISPASMTKVLTVLVAAENIPEEKLDDTFTMTFEITDYSYRNDCSAVGFKNDEVIKVRDLFYGTILPSGGDAAVGLATYVAGSHEAFVELMNKKLEELGLADTAHFTNCVGLYDENHYCTVYDMAIIMKAAMKNELCKEVLSTRYYTTAPTEQHPEGIGISNWFLRRIEDKDNETGGEVLCGKTGFVVESKNCAVSYGTFNGTPYICATTGSSSSWRCIYDHVDIYTQYTQKAPEGTTGQ